MKVKCVNRNKMPVAGQDLVDGTRLFWASRPPVVSELAACQCGGGQFLGNIHSIPMYENHATEYCEFYSEKESSPFLNKDYFKILQIFEFATKETRNLNYDERIFNLLHAWQECTNILSGNRCMSDTQVLIYYAASDSALLILDPAWKDTDENIKISLAGVLRNIVCMLKMMNSYKNAIKTCHLLLSLIKNPWSHNVLPKILNGNASREEVAKFLQFENSNIYVLRLRILCRIECETQVLRLSSMVMDMHEIELKQYFEKRDFEFIRDIYYSCLIWYNKKSELINHLAKYSHNDGKVLLESYSYKIKKLLQLPKKIQPRIYKSIVVVTEMASCILVANSLTNSNFFDDFFDLLKYWSTIITTLMNSNLELNMNGSNLKDVIYTFVSMAPTARHLYMISDVLNDKFGSKLPRTMSIYIYIKALCTNINEKKSYEHSNNRDGSLKSLKMLVERYLKFANQLEDILSVSRECTLTAYCLMPSNDLLAKIKNLAIKSGKLVTEHPINIPENTCNNMDIKHVKSSKRGHGYESKACKYDQKPNLGYKEDSYLKIHNDMGNLPDPLSKILVDDLIAVIKQPRFYELNWNLEWSKLKMNCEKYLKPMVTCVINGNTSKHSGYMHNNDTEENYERSANEIECLTNDTDYDGKKTAVLSFSRKRKIDGGSKKTMNQKKVSQIKSLKVESQIKLKNDLPKQQSLKYQKNDISHDNRWVFN